jgi:hypothetical protein
MTMVSAARPRQAADLDELPAERLGLGQHAEKVGLVGQHLGQRGIAASHPGPEGGERKTDRLAHPAADTDLLRLRPDSLRPPVTGGQRVSPRRARR